ncbi:helix-turn-helix transcriptional regulator [Micromonospora zamorensis]|uniref:helix-turn-helix domain-containing protein n=1 Tax=Micromonospora zamorensis TaxID=709883 RepID=UPI002E18DBF0
MGTSAQGDAAAAFVRELAYWRHHRAMSKKSLASRIGFDPSYVSHIESGRHKPTEEFARRVEAVLESGNRIWQRYLVFASTKLQRGQGLALGPTATPPPVGPHLVIEEELAALSLADGWYECRVRRHLHSVGTEPITRHTVQIDIDRFPEDPERSMAFHDRHPLRMNEVDFQASIGTDQPEPMRWKVLHSRNAFIKIVLMFGSDEVSCPLYPGHRTLIHYAYRVPAWKFGDWLQRDIRLPTRRLNIRLSFPSTSHPAVWGRETSFTTDVAADVTPSRRERDGLVEYEWEVPRPRLRAQYRLNWRYLGLRTAVTGGTANVESGNGQTIDLP